MYQFLMHGIKNNILFNTQKIKVTKAIKNSLYSWKEADIFGTGSQISNIDPT